MRSNSLLGAQLKNLVRHFFGRFFDSEVIATLHTEMHLLFVQVVGLLVQPGLLKVFLSITKYSYLAWFPVAGRNREVLIDMHFFISISMILTGFVTAFEWDTLFPDNKDYYNLTSLPIKPRTVFFAKLIALSLFLTVFHVAINGIPTLLFPCIVFAKSFTPGTAGFHIPLGQISQYQVAQTVSLFFSTLFIFTSLITLRAIFLVIFPQKLIRIASRFTQLGVILLLLCALLSGGKADQFMADGNKLIYYLPPFWFLGLYETMIGHDDAVIASLAKMACMAVTISGLLSIVTYTVSYQSSMRKGFQSAGIASYPRTRIKKIWTWLLHKTFLKQPIERASFHFLAQTAFRRQEHTLYWGSFVALGAAFAYSDLYALMSGSIIDPSKHLMIQLSFPFVMFFFILVGLRFIFTVPADLQANWVFKIIDKHFLKRSFVGIHKFMLTAIIIPLLVIFAPCYLMIWPPAVVLGHIVYALILSLILIELLLFGFMKLPFTCSYLPGKAKIILLGPIYVLTCYLYSYGMTAVEQWVLKDVSNYLVFILISAIVLFLLYRRSALFLRQNSAILFEESPPEERTILSIEP
jgi:hypothetical protein